VIWRFIHHTSNNLSGHSRTAQSVGNDLLHSKWHQIADNNNLHSHHYENFNLCWAPKIRLEHHAAAVPTGPPSRADCLIWGSHGSENVTPRSLVEVYWRFGLTLLAARSLLVACFTYSPTLKMETGHSSTRQCTSTRLLTVTSRKTVIYRVKYLFTW
jgi:hypothetical protein